MDPTDGTNATDRFLRELNSELATVPARQREAILDDVRAHIADALDSGRPPADVLQGLGTPRYVAAEYRAELDLPENTDAATRAALVLHLAAIVVGVVTAVFVAFLLPAFAAQTLTQDAGGSRTETYTTSTIADTYGLSIALLTLVPAVLAVLPLVLPRRIRQPVAVANAVILTLFSVVSGFTIGGFYLLMTMLMWAAAIVPWRIGHGFDLTRSVQWRIVGAVLIVLPALLVAAGWVSGSIQGTGVLVGLLILVAALAVLFAVGLRVVYLGIAAAGAALMVLGMLDGGFLILAFWWTGGLWLSLGLAAAVATTQRRSRTPDRKDLP